jgi:hypothetical protein
MVPQAASQRYELLQESPCKGDRKISSEEEEAEPTIENIVK